MNTKKTFLVLPLAFILFVVSACGPAPDTADPTLDTAMNTIIAETAQAAVEGTLTQVALSRPSDTLTPVFTETPMQTATIIPSATSNKPMISVSMETNCRLGPDTVYERVGQLDPGIMAEVFGLDPSRYYYYIQNPSQPGTYCWVWGFYVTRVNDFVGMPIYTPAYTPIPVNTSTPGLTTSPTVTGTIFPTATGTITTTGACTFVSQSPPNNFKYTAGASYKDLNWTVKNTGLTIWDNTKLSYKFVSGTNLQTNLNVLSPPANTDPGESASLLLDLIVPATSGTYTETWSLVQGSTTLCSFTHSIVVEP